MRRSLKSLVSVEAFKHLAYVPVIMIKVKNWYSFLMNYVGIKNCGETYVLRNGTRLKTAEGVDSATIAVIFIKKDYGAIPKKGVVIDIGANIGIFSLYAANASPKAKIYAFEPVPSNYRLLVENIKVNGMQDQITPVEAGVGAKTGKTKLYLRDGGPFHSFYSKEKGHAIDVRILSLKDVFDKYKIKHCDLLKSDCEGAEFDILYNTPDATFAKISEIKVEYHHNSKDKRHRAEKLRDFLISKGFRHTRSKVDNHYTGNFWFVNSKTSHK